MKALYKFHLEEIARNTGIRLREVSNQCEISFSELKGFNWKHKSLNLKDLFTDLSGFKSVTLSDQSIFIKNDIQAAEFIQFRALFLSRMKKLKWENFSHSALKLNKNLKPIGFDESKKNDSGKLLERLYQDDFLVREKKPVAVDLHKSYGQYLVSAKDDVALMDGCSQIASMNLGFNHPAKNAMFFRQNLFSDETDITKTDVYKAFVKLLQDHSGLKYVSFLGSGAESVEAAIRSCQLKYPERRRIVAFEGSFHGRSLLALHTTYNPAKRSLFEIYPGTVSFMPFPDSKSPQNQPAEPENWLKTWAEPSSKEFSDSISGWLSDGDELLSNEIVSLLKIRKELDQENKPLCVIVEPVQCEGGDRYASNRFFRALRLLTRALDVALVFDEVQTGVGLGHAYFWHKEFNLVDKDGNRDNADAVSCAKKSQVGLCVSAFPQELKFESSPVSLYRGYLQSLAALECDSQGLESMINTYLDALQKVLGSDLVSYPRGEAACFSFDLPYPEACQAMVKARFENGLLFYPAGTKTARFRMMASSDENDVAQVFLAIYRCFEKLAADGVIRKVPQIEDASNHFPKLFAELLHEKDACESSDQFTFPADKNAFLNYSREEWDRLFYDIFSHHPEVVNSSSNRRYTLSKINSLSLEQIWQEYEKDPDLSYLELLWFASRAFGTRVLRADLEGIKANIAQIMRLEDELYEENRRDTEEKFISCASDPNTVFLLAFDEEQKLIAKNLVTNISHFDHQKMVGEDFYVNDPDAYYSAALSVGSGSQGRGLGLRLKLEQHHQLIDQNAKLLRSRNMIPESNSMVRINRKFAMVTIDHSFGVYNGKGEAIYNSYELHKAGLDEDRFWFLSPHIKNKGTLANFVSPWYAENLLYIKDFLPEGLKHLYMASSRSEMVDKMIKLLFDKRKSAKIAISFSCDYFGESTAASRSLGTNPVKERQLSYFNWPVVDYSDKKSAKENWENFNKVFSDFSNSDVLGIFISPVSQGIAKDSEFLKMLREFSSTSGIPLIFDESETAFKQANSGDLFYSNAEIKPDAMMYYMGMQAGILAVSKALFIEKPLMMISTWDGDELGLSYFNEKLLAYESEYSK